MIRVIAASLLFLCATATYWLNADEQAKRIGIINEVNSKIGRTWTAGVNPRFDGTSFEYVKSLCGSFEDLTGSSLPAKDIKPMAVPDAFDSRDQWGKICPSVSEIRDQSNCGSCWAFGAAEAATDRVCIQTNGSTIWELSAEDVLACCNTCGSGCGGGYPSSAWTWIKNTGVVTGHNYHQYDWCTSYTLQNCDHHESGQYVPCSSLPSYPTPACVKSCDKEAVNYTTAYADDKRHFKTEYSVPNDVTKIQTDIMTNGPVEASFSVYEDFETYVTGVYVHKTGSYLGGHAVKIIGWGVDSGTPYLTVANSWNQDWGEKGFFRIIRGVNECGIEASIVAGMYA
jgi:cathepsin B